MEIKEINHTETTDDGYYLDKSSGLWGIVKLEGDDKLYLKSFKDETPEWTKDKIYAVKFKKDEAKEIINKLYQKDNDTKEDGSLEEEYRSWNVSEPSMFSNIEPNLEIPETDKEIIKNKFYGYGYIDKISDDGTIYAVFGNKVRLFPQDAFEKGYIVKMDESLKEELDQVEAGISSMFMDLINQEYSLLSQYESAQVTLNDLGENRFDDVLDYIKDDINIHIGMLQASIEDINPSAEKIDDGKEEADKLILDESLFKF